MGGFSEAGNADLIGRSQGRLGLAIRARPDPGRVEQERWAPAEARSCITSTFLEGHLPPFASSTRRRLEKPCVSSKAMELVSWCLI